MNAQLLELIATWRADSLTLGESDGYGAQLDRCADELEAALAAPKEAGDADALSEVTLTYAEQRKVIEHMTGELNAAIKLLLSAQQRAEAIDCQPLKGIRLAAPSKEAGIVSDGAFGAFYVCDRCRGTGVQTAAPRADQQGVEYDRELIADMLSEKVYDAGYGMKSHGAYTVEAIAEQMRLLREADNRDAAGVHTACKPSDQQGASLEGVPALPLPALPYIAPRNSYTHFYSAEQMREFYRQGWMDGSSDTAALSKASPDDQRQKSGFILPAKRENKHGFAPAVIRYNDIRNAVIDEIARLNNASPPTEAAAAVGGLLALALEIESRSFRDTTDDDLVRWSRQIKEAALSPTASAAREGSDG